jgi:hypothetical protein
MLHQEDAPQAIPICRTTLLVQKPKQNIFVFIIFWFITTKQQATLLVM